jgi:hypothetical protein
MPFATGAVFAEDLDANLSATCGFSTSNIATVDFGTFSISDDADEVGEVEVQLAPVSGSSASARVSVTVADWFGAGTRATGTLTLSGMAVTETVVVGSETYTAVSEAPGANEFDISGDDISDAANLAAVIRATDAANFKVSTAGTNVVTIDSVERGTAGNSLTLTGDTGATASGATLAGASDTLQLIMDGETTKFDMNVGSTISDTYANKRSVITLETAQEVLGGTNPAENIFFALMIDPESATFSNLPYDGPLTQTITVTVESACDGT